MPSIQKFMVSQATSFGFSTWPRTWPLQNGVDVAQEDGLRAAVRVGDLWLELLEDIEVRANGVARVQVQRVLALPVKRLTGRPLEPFEVDRPVPERRELLVTKVVADDGDEVDGLKNDAATEKNEALPPSTRSAVPKGVSTVS